jgi:serine/threonine protein kinase
MLPCVHATGRIKYALDIARGMNCLHHHGVIHSDLKPSNVLVTDSMRSCKVGDFGLSRVARVVGGSVSNKSGGGTPAYTVRSCLCVLAYLYRSQDTLSLHFFRLQKCSVASGSLPKWIFTRSASHYGKC